MIMMMILMKMMIMVLINYSKIAILNGDGGNNSEDRSKERVNGNDKNNVYDKADVHDNE